MHTYAAVLDMRWFVVVCIGERVGSCCLVPSRNAMGPFPVVRFLLKEAHPYYVSVVGYCFDQHPRGGDQEGWRPL